MHTKTVSISGTYFIPIDPSLLAQCPLGEEVDVSAEKGALIIRPVRRNARQGWAEALAAVPAKLIGDDHADLASFREIPQEWDGKDWEW